MLEVLPPRLKDRNSEGYTDRKVITHSHGHIIFYTNIDLSDFDNKKEHQGEQDIVSDAHTILLNFRDFKRRSPHH